MGKLPVAVVGATGLAGQQFLAALADHPWFDVVAVAASERSAGKRYEDAIRDDRGASRWFADGPLPPRFADLRVADAAAFDPAGLAAVFSAVDGEVARTLEPRYARVAPVISTASAYRYEPDVPLLLPPVNAGHAALLEVQRRRRGGRGFIAPIANCTTTGLAVTLAPLAERFGLEAVVMTSLQAVSGAGRSPGVAALDVVDNVVPFIPKEEEKVEVETKKILGALGGQAIRPHDVAVSCTCTRVAVLDGHTEAVFARLRRRADPDEVRAALREWPGAPEARNLPSAPPRWIEVHDDPYRPQPRLDREAGGGMTTSVGRIREDRVLGGVKLVLVSHNTKLGAARGAVLVAELLLERGLLSG
jgi:aspartate-semialdehyde dehydrogenase